MSFAKVDWQYRGLGMPAGIALTRPVRRSTESPRRRVLIVGDALGAGLRPVLAHVLRDCDVTLRGDVGHEPGKPTHVVFAFERRPAGAPERGWQLPLALSYRSHPSRLVWLDVLPTPMLTAPALREASARSGVEIIRPSEQALRRAPNGMISAAGLAALAGLIQAWTGASKSDTIGRG